MRVLLVDRPYATSIWILMSAIADEITRQGGVVASCALDNGCSWGGDSPMPGEVYRVQAFHAVSNPILHGINLVAFARPFAGVLRRFQPDIVQTNSYLPGCVAALCTRATSKARVVITRHGRLGALHPAARAATRLQLALSHLRIGVSKTVCEGDARMRVIYNGVDLQALAGARASQRPFASPYIACTGRLFNVKGQARLLAAFAQLRATHPHMHLVLIGDGPERANLLRQADRAGLQDRFHITGWLEHAQALRWMAHAALNVVPSTSVQEGFGLVLFEAIGLARPVVASRIPLFEELLNGRDFDVHLVDAFDVDALAAACDRCLHDHGRAPANPDLSAFSLERMAKDYVAAYQELLAS